ncbi:MAG: class II aldolase/adducin family protein [Prolixibacteraceae bacterium]
MDEHEGYIKFVAHWEKKKFPFEALRIEQINSIRAELIQKDWVGILPNGIGFGNISVRNKKGAAFVITGSATGGLHPLTSKHFALVQTSNVQKNQLSCIGETIASSESLSHAVFYKQRKDIQAVIHIHSQQLWQKQINKLPTSNIKASYGTPEMAFSISKLLVQHESNSGVFVMGGHPDGLIAFGQNLEEIVQLLLQL